MRDKYENQSYINKLASFVFFGFFIITIHPMPFFNPLYYINARPMKGSITILSLASHLGDASPQREGSSECPTLNLKALTRAYNTSLIFSSEAKHQSGPSVHPRAEREQRAVKQGMNRKRAYIYKSKLKKREKWS